MEKLPAQEYQPELLNVEKFLTTEECIELETILFCEAERLSGLPISCVELEDMGFLFAPGDPMKLTLKGSLEIYDEERHVEVDFIFGGERQYEFGLKPVLTKGEDEVPPYPLEFSTQRTIHGLFNNFKKTIAETN